MGALSKVVMASFFLGMVSGCGGGSGGGNPAAAPELSHTYAVPAPGRMMYYFNASASPVYVEVRSGAIAKTADLLTVGNSFQTIPPGEPVEVAGCSDVVAGTHVRVCWAAGWENKGQYLLGKMPEILAQVLAFGDPGEVDVLAGNSPKYEWGGNYNSRAQVAYVDCSAEDSDEWLKQVAVHELTHSAFHKATGSDGPGWLNEAMATTTESTKRGGYFDRDSGLYSTPRDSAGYNRVESIGRMLKILNPGLNAETIRTAVASGDPVRAISGMNTEDFSRFFWGAHKVNQPPTVEPGKYTVQPYSLFVTNSEIRASAPLETF